MGHLLPHALDRRGRTELITPCAAARSLGSNEIAHIGNSWASFALIRSFKESRDRHVAELGSCTCTRLLVARTQNKLVFDGVVGRLRADKVQPDRPHCRRHFSRLMASRLCKATFSGSLCASRPAGPQMH